DSRPVSASENAESIQRDSLNGRLKLLRDTRRALEDLERILRAIPNELGVEAVDRQGAFGQRLEIHADDRQHRRPISVAEDGAGEFLAGQILLDEDRLLIVLEQEQRLPGEVVAIEAKIAVGDPLRRAFVKRLDEKRKLEIRRPGLELADILHHGEPRRGNPVERQGLLRLCLVEAESEGERIAAGIRNPEELTDRRHLRFAVYAAKALGDVEDDIGSHLAEALRKIFRRLESDDFSQPREGRLDRRDRRGCVPLGKFIAGDQPRDREIENSTGRLFIGTRKLPVFVTAALFHWAGELCRLGLLVVGETDKSHRNPTEIFARESWDRVYKRRRGGAIIIPQI